MAIALGGGILSADEMIHNGGFQGGMTSWQTSGPGSTNSCDQQWHTGTSGCGLTSSGSAPAAYTAGLYSDSVRNLYQEFVVPYSVQSATLSWYDTIFWIGLLPTTYSVFFTDANSQNVGDAYALSASTLSQGWTRKELDVTGILGQHLSEQLTLNFKLTVPDLTFAANGLDKVSLSTTAAVVPEPASVVLLVTVLAGLAGLTQVRKLT
jgi:hypothetical protein